MRKYSPIIFSSISVLLLFLFSLSLVHSQAHPNKSYKNNIVFNGKEKFGLVFITTSQIGALRVKIRITIRNKYRRIVRIIDVPLLYKHGSKKNQAILKQKIASQMNIIKLKPGLYTISGYSGKVYKRYYNGIRTFKFTKRNIAYRFRVGKGLTSYLGNVKFDFTTEGKIHVSVKDMIERDLAWIQYKHPKLNFRTLDRQVIDPRYSNRHRY